MATELNESSFKTFINDEKPVLVEFYAPWCIPCKNMAPLLDILDKEVDYAKIAKVDIENCEGLVSEYNITSVPSFLYFKNGDLQNSARGVQSRLVIEKTLKSLI